MDKDANKKSKKVIIIYSILIVLVIAAVVLAIISFANSRTSIKLSNEIEIVPTLLDEIYSNSAWCGTFQLVWNDMQNQVVKNDIVFSPQIEIAKNLNKQSFTENDISEEYYFKAYGLKTLDLKEEIESGVKEKFNKESEMINLIDWSNAPQSDGGYDNDFKEYIFYTMLYREFTYYRAFDELDNDSFSGTEETYDDIEYFGIDEDSATNLGNQVEVLYYNSKKDFAVKVSTNEGDNVILAKGNNGNDFSEIYANIEKKSENYEGEKEFSSEDTLKIPNLNINIMKNYEELNEDNAGTFIDYDGNTCVIFQAIQSIEFSLDKTGGRVVSESSINFGMFGFVDVEEEKQEGREFNFDSTFNLLLVEDGKDKPYLALNIDNITLFQ